MLEAHLLKMHTGLTLSQNEERDREFKNPCPENKYRRVNFNVEIRKETEEGYILSTTSLLCFLSKCNMMMCLGGLPYPSTPIPFLSISFYSKAFRYSTAPLKENHKVSDAPRSGHLKRETKESHSWLLDF